MRGWHVEVDDRAQSIEIVSELRGVSSTNVVDDKRLPVAASRTIDSNANVTRVPGVTVSSGAA